MISASASYPLSAGTTTSAAIVASAATETVLQWDKMPRIITARWMGKVKGCRLSVILYTAMHTFGYGKTEDAISLDQFENGIVLKDGTVIDEGCGYTRETIVLALAANVRDGYMTCTKQVDPITGADLTSIYSVNVGGTLAGKKQKYVPVQEKPTPPVSDNSLPLVAPSSSSLPENPTHNRDVVYKRKQDNRSAYPNFTASCSSVVVSSIKDIQDAGIRKLAEELKARDVREDVAVELALTHPERVMPEIRAMARRKKGPNPAGYLCDAIRGNWAKGAGECAINVPNVSTPAPTLPAQRPQASAAPTAPPKSQEKAIDPDAFYASASPDLQQDIDAMAWNRAAITAANNPPLLKKIEEAGATQDMSSYPVAAAVRVARRDVVRAHFMSG